MSPNVSDSVRENAQELGSLGISDILFKTGNLEQAHEVLKNSWLAHPGFPGTALNLSAFYLQEKPPEPDKAEAFLTDGIAQLPNFKWFTEGPRMHLSRSLAYAMQGKCNEAMADYHEAIKDPDLIHEKSLPCPFKEN